MMLEKHAFIRYLISQQTFKKQRTIWILNFFAHNEEFLHDVCFVEDITNCPRSLIISAHGTEAPALLFRDEKEETSIAGDIIENIKKHKGKTLYVQVNFQKWEGNIRYLKVLEDNPFIDTLPNQQEISYYADEIIACALKEMDKKRIVDEIDEALDAKDRPLFEALVKKLAEL